jgi:hypothetical protein
MRTTTPQEGIEGERSLPMKQGATTVHGEFGQMSPRRVGSCLGCIKRITRLCITIS